MLNKLLSRRRNVYIFALIAIFIESFSAVCLKMAGLYPVISTKYIFYFGSAVAIMGIYAILWQILLEYMPLTTAYLWAFLIFDEHISVMQWIGTAIILGGMVVTQLGENKEDKK